MTFHTARVALLLLVLSCSLGCSGLPTDGGRLSLPTFGAPQQWEPEVHNRTAETEKDL